MKQVIFVVICNTNQFKMNFEQILALLGAKFQGVRKDGLAQLARVMALQCSNEDEAKALVEKVTEAQVTDFVKEYRKVVDAEVSNAGKNIEASLRKKMEAEAGKPKVNEEQPAPTDLAEAIKMAVASAVQPLQDKLAKYEQSEIGKSRLQALNDALSKCKDETFKAQTLKDFGRMSFSDDAAFNEYLTEKVADIKTANQSVSDAAMSGGAGAPQFGQKTEGGVSKAVAEYVASKSDAGALTGKEL